MNASYQINSCPPVARLQNKAANQRAFIIRIHLTNGSIESFEQDNSAEAQNFRGKIHPARLFLPSRLVLVGERSKSVYVTAQIVRVDFLQEINAGWDFPAGYTDIVELSEEDFRKHARLDVPEEMPKRNQSPPAGESVTAFLKLSMAGGKCLFLRVEAPEKLPVENHSYMRFLLSKGGFHMRLCGGGVGVVNLCNLLHFTVYPGVRQIPADSWLAEPVWEDDGGR